MNELTSSLPKKRDKSMSEIKNGSHGIAHCTSFVSSKDKDPEWDQFILETPDGHYTQTALWSEVKTVQGWSPLRLILKINRVLSAARKFSFESCR